MIARITGPATLSGTVTIASSKSEAHRALICAALCDATQMTEVVCASMAEDILVTVNCLRALGARVVESETGYEVWGMAGAMSPSPEGLAVLNVCESGSTLRFMLPIIAALGIEAEVHATGRIPERPLGDFLEALESGGARYESHTFPLKTSGTLKGGTFRLPGNVSSQYLTGLLLAAPLIQEELSIELTSPLESRGYLDLTIDIMRSFGVAVHSSRGGRVFTVDADQRYESPATFAVALDHSSAAFWLGANALGADIAVAGSQSPSLQPDAMAKDYFGKEVIDVSQAPDLFPIVAVVAAAQQHETRFINAQRLRYKESDRLRAVALMLESFGVAVVETEDSLTIQANKAREGCGRQSPMQARGELPFTGARIDSHGDHRIAMAAAVAATRASGITEITQAESVQKSYPTFFEDYERLGGHVELF